MPYDPQTLWSLVVFITLVLSGILLLTRLTTPDSAALGYWAAALLLSGLNIAGISARGRIPDFVSIELANAAGLLGAGLIWAGFRRFENRSLSIPAILAAPVLWLAVCQIPLFRDSTGNRVMLFAVMIMVLTVACILEVWRGRQERIVARIVAIAVLGIHFLIVASRIIVVQMMPLERDFIVRSTPIFAWYALAWLAFLVVMTFTMVAMIRERRELRYKQASVVDDLTGLLNRRGFMEGAVQALMPGRPVAMLALDLDRFKEVNDQHGHATGDRLLTLFGQVLRDNLRQSDVVGRTGGEEFGVLMSDTSMDKALEVAERIRQAFHIAAGRLNLAGVAGTVSIGISVGTASGEASLESISPMLARADAALYRAKAHGRDRVEVIQSEQSLPLLRVVG